MTVDSSSRAIDLAIIGSGGAGVVTAGLLLLEAAGRAGYYGHLRRSAGPQIRGGESAVLLRLTTTPAHAPVEHCGLVIALDWRNAERFADEIRPAPAGLVLSEAAESVPERWLARIPHIEAVPMRAAAGGIAGGRANMVALGLAAALLGLAPAAVGEAVRAMLARRGEEAVSAGLAGLAAGAALAAEVANAELTNALRLPPAAHAATQRRWHVSGNEAAGLGALRAGVRFVAAYPITPASELLEWLAPRLATLGGTLLQAEDELASVNMLIGASFGGVPALTATSGPGFALMLEGLGLAVATETPIVVIDVMRGGPSTGIPTKSEQSDLNIALYGMHGDAPHLVLAPLSVADCAFTTEWSVQLAERLQTVAVVLSDQQLAQSRAIVDVPARPAPAPGRRRWQAGDEPYARHAADTDHVSPQAIPGTPGGMYTAEGLTHDVRGRPSSLAADHLQQLDQRARKLDDFDYGEDWAEQGGDGALAVLCWGSLHGAVAEAVAGLHGEGVAARWVALRLLMPARPDALAQALAGVTRVLVVEQSHSRQFHHYLRAHYDLPGEVRVLARPGPLPITAAEIREELLSWQS